jgi:hypothetical protein
MKDNKLCVNNKGHLYWQKSILPLIIVILIMELVQFFNEELHDSPHECSKCHSTIDLKFVYNFNCSVQLNF